MKGEQHTVNVEVENLSQYITISDTYYCQYEGDYMNSEFRYVAIYLHYEPYRYLILSEHSSIACILYSVDIAVLL